MINRDDEAIEQGISVKISDSEDPRINARAVIKHNGESQDHVWLSVPTDYKILVDQEELQKLHEVIGAMLVALND